MEQYFNVIKHLKFAVKRLECDGLKYSKEEYKNIQNYNLIRSRALCIQDIARHINYLMNRTSNQSEINNAVADLNSLSELMIIFNNSSGKKHFTNFNYIRNYAIYKLKKVISTLMSLPPDFGPYHGRRIIFKMRKCNY